MAATIDVNQLVTEIEAAATGILQKDVTTAEGFAKTQVTAMATQAAWIATGTASGALTPELRDFFLDNLKTLAQNFAATLAGLAVITVEKLWNAVVGVLWTAIGKAIGVALPLPAA